MPDILPRIEWDDKACTGHGGFHVVSNLEHFIPPADWEVDPNDPTHFVPKYAPCRYRRLTQGTNKGRPFVKIHCLLFEDVVDAETCQTCADIQPLDGIGDDPVFDAEQPPSKYVRKYKPPKKPTPWLPCIYRKEIEKSDCCAKMMCKCEECPLFNKAVTKKDCRECLHRS